MPPETEYKKGWETKPSQFSTRGLPRVVATSSIRKRELP